MRTIACLLLCAAAAGCRPAPVYQVTPLDADAPWRQGRQVVWRDSGGVSMAVSFERTGGGHLVFDVAIGNHTDSTVRVDLSDARGTFVAEWIDPVEGGRRETDPVEAGAWREFTSPLDGDAILTLTR